MWATQVRGAWDPALARRLKAPAPPSAKVEGRARTSLCSQHDWVVMLDLGVCSWWEEPCFILPVHKVWFCGCFQWNQCCLLQWVPFKNPAVGDGNFTYTPTLSMFWSLCSKTGNYMLFFFFFGKEIRQMYVKSTWTNILKSFCWKKLQGDYKTQRI